MPRQSDKTHPRGLLTSDQAAEFLGVTRSTIKRWVDREVLKPQERRPSTPLRAGAMFFSREYLEGKIKEWAEAQATPETD